MTSHFMKKAADEIRLLKIDALPNVFTSRYMITVVTWLLVFAMSCGACIFLVVSAVLQYSEYKVITTVRYVTEQEAVVPTLTFCNINPFTSDYALNLLNMANVSTTSGDGEPVDYWQQYLQLEAYMNNTRGYYLTDGEKALLANFNMSIVPLAHGTVNTFYRFFHPRYFGCFRFNPNGTIITTNTENFFDYTLFTGNRLPTASAANSANLKGFYMFVQNGTDDPLGVDRDPILLTTGMQSRVRISRSFYHQHQQPYSDCGVLEEDNKLVVELADRSIFDMVIERESERPYTRKACLSACTQVRTVQVCGCNTRRIDFEVSSAEACSLDEELHCALGVWQASESLHAYCSTRCPIECSFSEFKVDITYAQPSLAGYNYWPYFTNTYWCAYWNLHQLGEHIYSSSCQSFIFTQFDYSYFYKDLVQVSLKYETLASIESEEVPKISGEELLGIIGGHLSLFLGMSLLSFIELVEFTMYVATNWYSSVASLSPSGVTAEARKERFHPVKKVVSHETRQHAQRLNMVALPNAVRSDHPFLSLFWFVMLLATVSFCSYLIVESVHEYEAHEVATTVEIERPEEAEFPTLTVCNLHPFTTSVADSVFRTMTKQYAILGGSSTNDAWEAYIFSEAEDWMLEQWGAYLSNLTLSLMTSLDKMVIKCTLNDKDCEFEWYFDYKNYICYRIRTEAVEDRKLDLHAVFYTGPALKISPQRGFNLFVENATRYPLLSTPTMITTGLGRRIDIKRTEYEQYPTPYSNCQVLHDGQNTLVSAGDQFDRKIFDMVVATNYSYSRDTCVSVCTQLLNKEACECQAYDNYVLDSETLFCSVRSWKGLQCVRNESVVEYCVPRCPLECTQNVYAKTVASYPYPTNYFDKYKSVFKGATDFYSPIDGHVDISNLSTFMYTTFVEFSLSYDSTQHEKYSEEPKMSGEELLGVLGGHLHLFLGMSAMSFVELVELMLAVCARLVLGKKY